MSFAAIERQYAPALMSDLLTEAVSNASRQTGRTAVVSAKSEEQEENPVKLNLSDSARNMLEGMSGIASSPGSVASASESKNSADSEDQERRDSSRKSPGELSDADRETIRKLRSRDAEVRAHEQQHVAALGGYAAGAPTYVYQTGPDGISYAIGGSLKIGGSAAASSDPEAALSQARRIKAAVTAVGDPSSADIDAATSAAALEKEALTHIRKSQLAAYRQQ